MSDEPDACDCKVGRVTAEYGLSGTDAELVAEWRGGTSVRDITDELNEDIVESALGAANVGNVEWSRTPVYEALHTDELSDADALEIRRELDRAGVAVEQVADDLVSHQTVYRHLTGCLDASKDDDASPEERRARARDTVYALQRRTEAVTETTLESLQTADVTDLGDAEVLVDLQVVCNDCGRSMDFETAVREGCRCPPA